MKQNHKLYITGFLLIALLLVLGACNGGSEPATTPTEDVAVPTVTDTPVTVAEAEPTEKPAEEDNAEAKAADGGSEAASEATGDSDSYPEPEPTEVPDESVRESYIPARPEGYAGPTATPSYPLGPDFNIDEPVLPGSTTVTGTGPAGVPLRLINVSEMGPLIAETIIDEDGTFEFEFETPLDDQISIGLKIGDLRNIDNEEGWTYDDFVYSPNYFERAFVGILLDLVSTVQ